MWASQVLELDAGRSARHVARHAGTGANADAVSNVSKCLKFKLFAIIHSVSKKVSKKSSKLEATLYLTPNPEIYEHCGT